MRARRLAQRPGRSSTARARFRGWEHSRAPEPRRSGGSRHGRTCADARPARPPRDDDFGRRPGAAATVLRRGGSAGSSASPAPGSHGAVPARERLDLGPAATRSAAVVLLVGGVAFAISRAGGGGDDPAPAVKGPARLKTIDLTIPEGLSRAEMAEIAKDAGLRGDYEKETAKPPRSLDAKEIGFPDGASLEGFLFPATYNLERDAPVKDLVGEQLEAFDQNIAQVDLKAARKKNLTAYDVVTVASMIEREVQVAKERPLVAAVIYNRLADGEALGIDATLATRSASKSR